MNSDEWSTREKLAISSYVLNSGGQHWGGNVLRMLVPLGEPDRTPDFFSAKKCAQQYSMLTEAAQTPKRKRGERSESTESSSSTSSHSSSSIEESIVKKLTLERIEEIKRLIRAEKSKYRKVKHQIDQINSGDMDERLDSMIADIEKKQLPKQDEDRNAISGTLNPGKNNKTVEKTDISDTLSSATIPNKNISEKTTLDKSDNSVLKSPSNLEEIELKSKIEDINKDTETPTIEFKIETGSSNKQDDVSEISTSTLNETATVSKNTSPPFSKDDSLKLEQSPSNNRLNTDISNAALPTTNEVTATVDEENHIKEVETENPDNTKENFNQETLPVQESVNKKEDISLHREDQYTLKDCEIQTETDSEKRNEYNETLNTDSAKTIEITSEDTAENLELISKKENDEIEPLSKNVADKPNIFTKDDTPITSSQQEKEVEIDTEDAISHRSLSITDEYADSEKLDDSSIGFPLSMPSTPAYVDSFPSSPALSNVSDADLESSASSRAWKKSIMILWKQVASHRYASLFLQPVTDDIAPNYSKIVYRAMDLSLLKKNLETGVVRTTSDFQRDLMLMFENALMYNNIEHDVYKMTLQMQSDVMDQVAQFLATQLMLETVQQTTPKGLRRSTLRKSAVSEKVSEARSKRTAAIEGENRYIKK